MDHKVIVFGVDGLIPELVYKFSEEGHLPNISQMLKEGASAELLPFISTWGDVNWVSFMSGQSPGTSWKGNGIPPDNENNLLGCMQREGKRCALVHFAETLSADTPGHFQFAPFWGGKGHAPFELASPGIYSTAQEKGPGKPETEFLGWPAVGTLAHHKKGSTRRINKDSEGLYFKIAIHNQSEIIARVTPVNDDSIDLKIGTGRPVRLKVNDWSQWVTVNTAEQEGIARFKLLSFDRTNLEMDILQSQMNLKSGYSGNPELEQYLLNRCGPYISKWTVQAGPDELYADTSFEEGEYQAVWLAEAALSLLKERGFDLFATVFRLNDETHHTCLGEYDPASPFYDPVRAEVCESVMRRSYEVLDRTIGKILSEKDEDTLLILASDHGGVPNAFMCDIYRRLEESGLCKIDKAGMPVLSESRAYLKDDRGGLEVYVNLKGREPHGIVEKYEYEKVQNHIFLSLAGWFHDTPKGIENVAGLVLKKEHAAPIGYWGSEMGDVIFAYNQGFVWGFNEKRDVVAAVSTPGANHGPQIPTAFTAHSSNFGISLFHGPKVRAGTRCGRNAPYRMNDAGTTIAKYLGITSCAHLDGRLMLELIDI